MLFNWSVIIIIIIILYLELENRKCVHHLKRKEFLWAEESFDWCMIHYHFHFIFHSLLIFLLFQEFSSNLIKYLLIYNLCLPRPVAHNSAYKLWWKSSRILGSIWNSQGSNRKRFGWSPYWWYALCILFNCKKSADKTHCLFVSSYSTTVVWRVILFFSFFN